MAEITQQQQKNRDREKLKGLFSGHPEVKAEAVDTLKDAWEYDKTCFRTEEMANYDPQAVALMAMRRDTIKEFIDWITKI